MKGQERLIYGWYAAGNEWRRVAVTAAGFLRIVAG